MKVKARAACFVIIALALAISLESSAEAQDVLRLPSGYQGTTGQLRRPTVSPYLDLLRGDVGSMPSYYTFVRPKVEQQRQQTNQWQAIRRLQSTGRSASSSAEVRPTGHGGHFNNYLHYYSFGSRFR